MIWLHLYDGNADAVPQASPCGTCGAGPKDARHFANGGVVCDVIEGACACGAWHDGIEEHLKRELMNMACQTPTVYWDEQQGWDPGDVCSKCGINLELHRSLRSK